MGDIMSEIILYSSDTCPHCDAAKKYLRDKGFKYMEKNVQKDKNFRRELIDKGYRGVPVIVIDDIEIVGFDKVKINQVLHIQ